MWKLWKWFRMWVVHNLWPPIQFCMWANLNTIVSAVLLRCSGYLAEMMASEVCSFLAMSVWKTHISCQFKKEEQRGGGGDTLQMRHIGDILEPLDWKLSAHQTWHTTSLLNWSGTFSYSLCAALQHAFDASFWPTRRPLAYKLWTSRTEVTPSHTHTHNWSRNALSTTTWPNLAKEVAGLTAFLASSLHLF